MIRRLLFSTIFLAFQVAFSQDATIYYNKDWKETTKDNALFYRPMPFKAVGKLVLVKDFYKGGLPQFEGYALKKDDDQYVGDVAWYDEDGFDSSFYQYKNSSNNTELNYYQPDGKIRKKVTYKNGVKDGETIIYDYNGEILMKGIYKEGKPVSGDFETLETDYSTNKTDQEVEDNPPPPKALRPMRVATKNPEEEGKSPKKDARKTIALKIFWANTRNLAQEKIYVINEYGTDQIQQKNFDVSGKLIQTIAENNFDEYNHRIINGIEYQYFLRNNFAVALKSTTPFYKKEKSGKSTAYYNDGKILSETIYNKGSKEGPELVYDKKGNILKKCIYKQDEPFSGNFDEPIAEFTINLNYANGKKEGEAIVKDEDGKMIANGIYKDNEPFNGTFITEKEYDNGNELINVVNFKKDGLQKMFDYRLENLTKTYTIKNEKLNGITTYYDDGKVVSTLEYKDDEPYNGTMSSDKSSTVYKNGNISTQIFYNSDFGKRNEDISKQKFYENGIISKIKDNTYSIPADPQVVYEGIYKDGKPFSGYFETDEDNEFKQVNFYENGQPKYQYSNDFLQNMDNYRHQTYDVKSTYKDGKIYDGVEYNLSGRQFVSRYFQNGILKSFDWDLFAVNYFNRIHFELKGNTIEMTDMQEEKKAKITLDIAKDSFTTKLGTDKYVIDERTYTTAQNFNSKYFEKLILYTVDAGKVTAKNVYVKAHEHDDYGGSKFFYRAYELIDDDSKTVQSTFQNLSINIGTDENEPNENGKYIISGIRLDKTGKPKDGVMITNNPDESYKIEAYDNGKIIKTINNVAFKDLKTELEKLENRY